MGYRLIREGVTLNHNTKGNTMAVDPLDFRTDDICQYCGEFRARHTYSPGVHLAADCPNGATLAHPSKDFDPLTEAVEVAAPAVDASATRKATPLFSGCIAYFPDALAAVARLSKAGNDKHNPGEPLHWAKGKSGDHADCLVRHLLEHGKPDPDTGFSHTVAVAWRALALLQTEIENAKGGDS